MKKMDKITNEKLVEIFGEIEELGGLVMVERSMVSFDKIDSCNTDVWTLTNESEKWEDFVDELFEIDIKGRCMEEYQVLHNPNCSLRLLEGNYVSHNIDFTGYRFFREDGSSYIEIFPISLKYLTKPHKFDHYPKKKSLF